MTEIIHERIQIQSKAKKCIYKPVNDTPEVKKLAALKFNYYSRLSIDLSIIFADGFTVILSAVALPVFNPKHFTKPNKLTYKTRKFHTLYTQFADHHKRANFVGFRLKWFIDTSWFLSTEQEILAVYKASACEKKIQNSPCSVYK